MGTMFEPYSTTPVKVDDTAKCSEAVKVDRRIHKNDLYYTQVMDTLTIHQDEVYHELIRIQRKCVKEGIKWDDLLIVATSKYCYKLRKEMKYCLHPNDIPDKLFGRMVIVDDDLGSDFKITVLLTEF